MVPPPVGKTPMRLIIINQMCAKNRFRRSVSTKGYVTTAGFEPAPTNRWGPEPHALDHSATLSQLKAVMACAPQNFELCSSCRCTHRYIVPHNTILRTGYKCVFVVVKVSALECFFYPSQHLHPISDLFQKEEKVTIHNRQSIIPYCHIKWSC